MRSWMALMLVAACGEQTVEEHFDSLVDRIDKECGTYLFQDCDAPPLETMAACLQRGLEQGTVVRMAERERTTRNFFHLVITIAADGELWRFHDVSDEHAGSSFSEYGPCTGPITVPEVSPPRCPRSTVAGCPPRDQ